MKNLKELRLDYCDECMQMTNHLDDECQKCKAKEKGIEKNYDDYDEYGEENYQKKRGYFEEDEDY